MKKILWPVLPVLVASILGGCASNPDASYVSDKVRSIDANVLATDTVAYLSEALPPARTTLLIEPPKSGDAVTPVMLEKLRQRGYGVTTYTPQKGIVTPIGTPFRYAVSPLDNGVWLRLSYPGKEATRFYLRTTAGLMANSPFTVKEGAASE
ncbi:hypothetical protein [Tatumella sp. UCD-D_suzukii]|uniref:hypothetical protein n=1 Tax=Tatumella sp. UCD-D_suzukii TaxID=1408192 RepID=UPI00046EA8CC|nr:hypothetical protein [Tatumella sp. UCD-D_suzukii]